MKKQLLYFLSLALFLSASSAFSADNRATPLKAGDSMPEEFKLATYNVFPPEALDLNRDIRANKGRSSVLLFVRSVDWCKYCKAQLREWNAVNEKFVAVGYDVAAISYGYDAEGGSYTPEKNAVRDFINRNDISYPVLTDSDSSAIKSFGILNTKFKRGSRFYGIPNPAIYVINSDGIITHYYAEENYKDRPIIAEIASDLNVSLTEAASPALKQTPTPAAADTETEAATEEQATPAAEEN